MCVTESQAKDFALLWSIFGSRNQLDCRAKKALRLWNVLIRRPVARAPEKKSSNALLSGKIRKASRDGITNLTKGQTLFEIVRRRESISLLLLVNRKHQVIKNKKNPCRMNATVVRKVFVVEAGHLHSVSKSFQRTSEERKRKGYL